MSNLKKVWRLLKGNRMLYIVAIVSTLLATLCSVMSPIVIKITVDSVLDGQPLDAPAYVVALIERLGGVSVLARNIWLCSLAIIIITALNGLFAFARGRSVAVASENIGTYLKDSLYDHLQRLPYDYHVKAKTGDLIQRCTSDVETTRRFLSGQVIEVVRTLLIAVVTISLMIPMSVKLTLTSVVILPFIFMFSYIFFKKVQRQFKLADEKEGELSTVLQENLSGIRVVRAFGRQRFEVDKFEAKNSEFRGLQYRLIRLLAYFWSISDFMCFTQIGVTLIVGVFLTLRGEISLGEFIVFNTYVRMLIWPVRQLGRILSDMGKMGISMGRIYEILNTPVEPDTEGATDHPLEGDIVFDNVVFEYEKDNEIIKGLSFRVKAGETIAVLGTTGSGKSTIMHILLRLYDYKSGSVKINGSELRNIRKKWLREKIGIVLQEPFLYSKTIRENIRMANHAADDDDIYDATKTAAIHNAIEEFEHKYDTIVGEKGVTLSGGQKQRVAIARTLIKNSSILIFDDSLSAVDTETDLQIRNALKEKRSDATTFIISQRITTLKEADRIFVIEDGRMTDSGTHDELVSRDGLYKRIWTIQTLLEDDFAEELEGADKPDKSVAPAQKGCDSVEPV